MQNFYFTFGSDPLYPYGRKDYVVVEADSLTIACQLFNLVHQPRHGDVLNCAFIYTEKQFNKFRDEYYRDVMPVEVISLQITRRKEPQTKQ